MFKQTLTLVLAFSMIPLATAEPLKLVSSIRPIALIAVEIAEGVAELETLLPPGASPHDYSLRPSDRRLLDQADLLIWTGIPTEPYLERVISASGVKNLAWIDAAENQDTHQHSGHSHDSDKHAEEPHEEFHPWLDPQDAVAFAARIADSLKQLAPLSATRIEQNLQRFQSEIVQMEQANRERIKGLEDEGFIVFHDAYRGLVDHYGLNQVAAFTLDPSRKPGARHLQNLRDQILSQNVRCVFVEPQFKPATLDAVTRDLNLKRGLLDPLASEIELSRGAYTKFIAALISEISTCLAPD